jgi:large subunit ribosomal protein L6
MSRIGRLPITVPAGVKVDIKGSEVSVTGPKGTLKRSFHPNMTINLKDNILTVARASDERGDRALHGLTRSLLSNMVEGVTKGYQKDLEIVGVGYRAEKAGDKIVLKVGLSRPLEVTPLPGVSLAIEGTNKIKVTGMDKEAVGENAAKIRFLRLPDIYKGKGIKYAGEVIRLKPGKAGKVIGKK